MGIGAVEVPEAGACPQSTGEALLLAENFPIQGHSVLSGFYLKVLAKLRTKLTFSPKAAILSVLPSDGFYFKIILGLQKSGKRDTHGSCSISAASPALVRAAAAPTRGDTPRPPAALTSLMLVWTTARSILQEGRLAVAQAIASLSGAFCSCFFCTEK